MDTFLGEPISYWLELQKRADALGVTEVLRELVETSAKVSYYEKHIAAMNSFKAAAEK